MGKNNETKLGLFKTKKAALNDAAKRRKFADNDINPRYTTFYRVQKTKMPRDPKRPGYYVIKTSRRKSKKSIERARKNLGR